MLGVIVAGIVVASAASPVASLQNSQARPRTVVGELKRHEAFRSAILNNSRDLWVWLPPDYEKEPNRRYPVLYMGDGQNLFNLETSYLPDQEWRVDETATSLIRAKLIPSFIVVGVNNAGADRGNEYLPTRSNNMGGRVGDFGRFLVEEVKPMIDRTYRTKRGRNDTALAGSSFGGIMTLAVGLRHPDVFGKLAALSPSVWWDQRQIIKEFGALKRSTGQRVWLDMGTREGESAVPNLMALSDQMVAKGWKPGKDLAVVIDSDAAHNESAWAKRMDAILLWFFR